MNIRLVLERKELWSGARRTQPLVEIRRVMREKGVTNEEMSARTGIDQHNMDEILKGLTNIRIDTLYLLVDALDVGLSVAVI